MIELCTLTPIARFGVNTNAAGTARGAQVVRAGGLVLFAAIPSRPFNAAQGIAEQTHQVLACVERRLQWAGSSKHHMLSVQIMLSDRANLAAMNAVWDAWVSQTAPPVRFCQICSLTSEEMLVEMAVTAVSSGAQEPVGGDLS